VYSVEFMPEAQKNLACLDKVVAQRVLNKLKWLAANFELVKPEPLTSQWRGLYKLRVGSYRVIYNVDRTAKVITVHLIGHRREIYKWPRPI